jgi:DNA primase
MPDGLDPDEVVGRDPEEWKHLLENAKPVVTHVMDTLAAGKDLKDPKVKNQIASQILPLIEDLPNPLERDTYRQQLARMLRVDESALAGARGQTASRRTGRAKPARIEQPQASESSPVAVAISSAQKVEVYIVAVLFRKPELLYRLDRILQQHDLTPLASNDFEYTDHQILFDLIRQALEQDQTEHHEFIVQAMPESLRGFSLELLAQTEKQHVQDEKLLEDLSRGVKRMRDDATRKNRNEYRILQEEAQERGDAESVASYRTELMKLTQFKRLLDEFDRKLSLKRLE